MGTVVPAGVGPRLRELRKRRGATLTALSDATGIPAASRRSSRSCPRASPTAVSPGRARTRATDERAVEFLSILGPQGERMHIRARFRPDGNDGNDEN
ncbi:hypothetical protein ACOKM5_08030 [Streptomyces sp. BH097]|uniref:hypothetical protein n=1 Tax=unclassified Streptomyces TaxID=2593676 RepID=UPI003BB56E86